jgi:AcrR family transcriptional regulator
MGMQKLDDSSNAGSSPLPARRKGRERRQQIIDTAKEVLMTSGITSLVLRDIAVQLGITHGNLQYYFPTKEDLLVAIFDQELIAYTDSLHNAAKQTTSRQGRIAAILDAGLALTKSKSTTLWRMLISFADQRPQLAEILKKQNMRYDTEVAEELAVIIPEVSEGRRKHIAQIVRMMLDGFSIQLTWDDPNSPEMRALESELKVTLATWILLPEDR